MLPREEEPGEPAAVVLPEQVGPERPISFNSGTRKIFSTTSSMRGANAFSQDAIYSLAAADEVN